MGERFVQQHFFVCAATGGSPSTNYLRRILKVLASKPNAFCRHRSISSHSAHKPEFVTVHYPWHALYGQKLRVHRRYTRGSDAFFACELSDGTSAYMPQWIFDPAFCAVMELGVAQAST